MLNFKKWEVTNNLYYKTFNWRKMKSQTVKLLYCKILLMLNIVYAIHFITVAKSKMYLQGVKSIALV